jgi:signal transduction histidine kinase
MKVSAGKKIGISFLLVTALMAAVGLSSYFSINKLIDASSRQVHTYQVLSRLDNMLSLLKDAEAEERDFIIVGTRQSLERYTAAISEIEPALKQIQQLVTASPVQQQRLVALRSKVAEKLAELDKTITVLETKGFESTRRAVQADKNRKVMDEIRRLVDQIKAEETGLLAQRTSKVSVFSRHSEMVIGWGWLLATVLLALTGWLLSRNIAKSEASIHKLSEDLAIRNLRLETANKEMEAFSYSVSHDLRAPLNTISGFSEILMEQYADKLDDEGRDYLNRINKSSYRMGQLIIDLLRLSHISRQNVERMDCDLSSLASTIMNNLCESDPTRSIEVAIAAGLRAVVDPNLMKIALTNLLQNAWKFTSKTANARIEFGAMEKDGMQTVYFVKDNGAGFSPAYAEKMFLPFQRLHSKEEFEGTGIGLAIVERIISRHEGKVWAEGQVGKGATIYFVLGQGTRLT